MDVVELNEWPGIEDLRPIKQEDTFQNKPFIYAVNSNRGLYTDFGMRDELAAQGMEVFRKLTAD